MTFDLSSINTSGILFLAWVSFQWYFNKSTNSCLKELYDFKDKHLILNKEFIEKEIDNRLGSYSKIPFKNELKDEMLSIINKNNHLSEPLISKKIEIFNTKIEAFRSEFLVKISKLEKEIDSIKDHSNTEKIENTKTVFDLKEELLNQKSEIEQLIKNLLALEEKISI